MFVHDADTEDMETKLPKDKSVNYGTPLAVNPFAAYLADVLRVGALPPSGLNKAAVL